MVKTHPYQLLPQISFYGDGRGYRGNISTTILGYTCQSWDLQYPHVHKMFTGQIYNEIRNSSSYCLNPGGLSLNGPWCYTTNKTVEWELCDVPKCAQQLKYSVVLAKTGLQSNISLRTSL